MPKHLEISKNTKTKSIEEISEVEKKILTIFNFYTKDIQFTKQDIDDIKIEDYFKTTKFNVFKIENKTAKQTQIKKRIKLQKPKISLNLKDIKLEPETLNNNTIILKEQENNDNNQLTQKSFYIASNTKTSKNYTKSTIFNDSSNKDEIIAHLNNESKENFGINSNYTENCEILSYINKSILSIKSLNDLIIEDISNVNYNSNTLSLLNYVYKQVIGVANK